MHCLLVLSFVLLALLHHIHAQQQPSNAAAALCGANGWTIFKGNCYKVFAADQLRNGQAKHLCNDFGAELASVHSREENDFIARMSTPDFELCQQFCDKYGTDGIHYPMFEKQPIFRSFWIGLHRQKGPGGKYECSWDDGSACDYGAVPTCARREDWGKQSAPNFPWSTGQPSGNGSWEQGPPETCVHFWWKTGWWNDVLCMQPIAGAICKKPVKCQ